MTLRNGHGTGAGVPRVEVLPADELPPPDPRAVASGPVVRRLPSGQFADRESARAAARAGGKKSAEMRAERTRLLTSLGLARLEDGHAFAPYERAASDFAAKHIATLAAQFDGTTGEGPASIVQTAAIQLAASRYMYDLGKQSGDAKALGEASRLGDASRQNILAAYELQAREAKAREKAGDGSATPWLEPERTS